MLLSHGASILHQKRPAISHVLQLFPSPTTVKPSIFLFLMSYICRKRGKKMQREIVRLFPAQRSWVRSERSKSSSQPCEMWSYKAASFPWLLIVTDRQQGGCLCPWCFCFWEHWWLLPHFFSVLFFLLFFFSGLFTILLWFWVYCPSGMFLISVCLILKLHVVQGSNQWPQDAWS